MNEVESQPWYQLYASAVVELDPERLMGAWRLRPQALPQLDGVS